MKFSFLVTYGKDNVDKATISFTLANAALDNGHQVMIVLPSEGVRLTVKGYADDINNRQPFLPFKELMETVIKKGAEINVCMPCMAKRGLTQEDMISGVKFIDGAGLIRIVGEADRTIQL